LILILFNYTFLQTQ